MPIDDLERKQAKLERIIVTRMNALAKLWSTKLRRPTDTVFRVYSEKRSVEVSYDVYVDGKDLSYELKVHDDLSGRTVYHVTIAFPDEGNEVIPNQYGNGIVFGNSSSQARVFAESMAEFVRILHLAEANRNEIVEKASKLLPRSA